MWKDCGKRFLIQSPLATRIRRRTRGWHGVTCNVLGGWIPRRYRVRFNNSLNVLIGGRGTGKSTIIESIRFVLEIEPLAEEARKQHRAFVSQVLGSRAKVSLLLRSQTPSPREYLIERTSGSRASVKDSDGNLTELFPANIAAEVEVFGQHEISELARSEERLTGLLDRFVAHTSDEDTTEDEIKARLETTREQMVSAEKGARKDRC